MIDSERSSAANLIAVYLLYPTKENVKFILEDFKKGKDKEKAVKYKEAHIYFITGITLRLYRKFRNPRRIIRPIEQI